AFVQRLTCSSQCGEDMVYSPLSERCASFRSPRLYDSTLPSQAFSNFFQSPHAQITLSRRRPGNRSGSPARIVELVRLLPFLRVEDIAPCLVQKRDWVIPEGMDVPARLGDEYPRLDECSVLDFLGILGVPTEIRDHYVPLKAPLFRSVV